MLKGGLDGKAGGAIVVLIVIAGVVVDVSWVPRAVWEPLDPVVGVSHYPPALDAAVDRRPFGANFRFGRRDRGRRVVGVGHNIGRDVTGLGAC